MKRRTALLLLGLLTRFACAAPESTARHVEAVFFELSQLRAMQPRERYRLPAEGELLAGGNDDFLRRRTAAEVRTSGLSCDCGDYAIVFIDLIRPRGFETLLIDSAQISSVSLAHHFAGHAVVAIRPGGETAAPWWLVDSTAHKAISRDWGRISELAAATRERRAPVRPVRRTVPGWSPAFPGERESQLQTANRQIRPAIGRRRIKASLRRVTSIGSAIAGRWKNIRCAARKTSGASTATRWRRSCG